MYLTQNNKIIAFKTIQEISYKLGKDAHIFFN